MSLEGYTNCFSNEYDKFGMDSYGHSQLPSDGLKRLNRVVEKNMKSKYVRHNVLWFI